MYISKTQNEIIIINYNISSNQKIIENLNNSMNKFAKVNGIKLNKDDSKEIIIQNLSQIISWLEKIILR